jgi:hypothetical protein
MPIQSKNHLNQLCTLTDAQGLPVLADTQIYDSGGLGWVIEGGTAPHKPGSTGKVIAKHLGLVREFYPGVFDLRWEVEPEVEPGFGEWLYQSERRHTQAGIL